MDEKVYVVNYKNDNCQTVYAVYYTKELAEEISRFLNSVNSEGNYFINECKLKTQVRLDLFDFYIKVQVIYKENEKSGSDKCLNPFYCKPVARDDIDLLENITLREKFKGDTLAELSIEFFYPIVKNHMHLKQDAILEHYGFLHEKVKAIGKSYTAFDYRCSLTVVKHAIYTEILQDLDCKPRKKFSSNPLLSNHVGDL